MLQMELRWSEFSGVEYFGYWWRWEIHIYIDVGLSHNLCKFLHLCLGQISLEKVLEVCDGGGGHLGWIHFGSIVHSN